MKIEMIKISKLNPTYNTNGIEKSPWVKLLVKRNKCKWVEDAIVVSYALDTDHDKRPSNVKLEIVDGHHRYTAARQLGIKSIPCVVYNIYE